jgi:hypothetical protein
MIEFPCDLQATVAFLRTKRWLKAERLVQHEPAARECRPQRC